jgi:DegV family protein with EDD domain
MYNAYLSGAKEVMQNKNMLNKINVFPVADGDTGTNLFSTMSSIIKESAPFDSVKTTMDSIADSALKGARGNSGIIFAQYLYGLSVETGNEPALSVPNFIESNIKAVKYAYQSIAEPVEGTIITVIKEWANALNRLEKHSTNFIELITNAYAELEKSVINTTNQLKILKINSVVDSGAKGFAFFIKGFLEHLRSNKEEFDLGDMIALKEDLTLEEPPHIHLTIQHRYCTEAMVESPHLDIPLIKQELGKLGDSLLVASNSQKAKIHLHTDEPHRMFEILMQKGTITYQKVDDMKKQNDVIERRKAKIALVTDSIADIPKDFVDEHQIHVIPLNLLLGEVNYLDKLTIRNPTVMDYVDHHSKLPTSSQPDYKSVENLFSFLSSYYESILVITVAKPLSGTHSLISKVASDMKEKFPEIYVVDSKQNSGAQGLMIKRAATYIENNLPLADILKNIDWDASHGKILVNVKSIDNMIKSGRLSVNAGKIAKLIHLKPIVSLDETGKGNLAGAAISFKGSLSKSIKTVKNIMKTKTIENYCIVHVENPEEANSFAETMKQMIGKEPDYIEEVSSITSVAAGKGTIALAYITN